jgi:hypothetical protein
MSAVCLLSIHYPLASQLRESAAAIRMVALKGKTVESHSVMEKSAKFKGKIEAASGHYLGIQKELQKVTKQTIITRLLQPRSAAIAFFGGFCLASPPHYYYNVIITTNTYCTYVIYCILLLFNDSIFSYIYLFTPNALSSRETSVWSWVPRGPKPRMTVLAKATSNLSNRPTMFLSCHKPNAIFSH